MVSVESVAKIIAKGINDVCNPAYYLDIGLHYTEEDVPSVENITEDLPAIFAELRNQLQGLSFVKKNDIEYIVSYKGETIRCYYVFDDMEDYNEITYNYVVNLIKIEIISNV